MWNILREPYRGQIFFGCIVLFYHFGFLGVPFFHFNVFLNIDTGLMCLSSIWHREFDVCLDIWIAFKFFSNMNQVFSFYFLMFWFFPCETEISLFLKLQAESLINFEANNEPHSHIFPTLTHTSWRKRNQWSRFL